MISLHLGASFRHFYDICVAAGLEIMEIKIAATKGHYAVSFKALPVLHVLEQLIQGALGAGDKKIAIESVVESSFHTPPIPPAATASTTVTRAFKRLSQVSSGGSSSRQVSSGGSSPGPSFSTGRIQGPPQSATTIEEIKLHSSLCT